MLGDCTTCNWCVAQPKPTNCSLFTLGLVEGRVCVEGGGGGGGGGGEGCTLSHFSSLPCISKL